MFSRVFFVLYVWSVPQEKCLHLGHEMQSCESNRGKRKRKSQDLRQDSSAFDHIPVNVWEGVVMSTPCLAIPIVLQAKARSEDSVCALRSNDNAWRVVDIGSGAHIEPLER
jgi:hypothetical protein